MATAGTNIDLAVEYQESRIPNHLSVLSVNIQNWKPQSKRFYQVETLIYILDDLPDRFNHFSMWSL